MTDHLRARRHTQYPSAQHTVGESAARVRSPDVFIARINTCSRVMSLQSTPLAKRRQYVRTTFDGDASRIQMRRIPGIHIVSSYSKTRAFDGGRGDHSLRMLREQFPGVMPSVHIVQLVLA